jgi:hypothetical protein
MLFETIAAARVKPTRAFARRFSSWQRRVASGCFELRFASVQGIPGLIQRIVLR